MFFSNSGDDDLANDRPFNELVSVYNLRKDCLDRTQSRAFFGDISAVVYSLLEVMTTLTHILFVWLSISFFSLQTVFLMEIATSSPYLDPIKEAGQDVVGNGNILGGDLDAILFEEFKEHICRTFRQLNSQSLLNYALSPLGIQDRVVEGLLNDLNIYSTLFSILLSPNVLSILFEVFTAFESPLTAQTNFSYEPDGVPLAHLTFDQIHGLHQIILTIFKSKDAKMDDCPVKKCRVHSLVQVCIESVTAGKFRPFYLASLPTKPVVHYLTSPLFKTLGHALVAFLYQHLASSRFSVRCSCGVITGVPLTLLRKYLYALDWFDVFMKALLAPYIEKMTLNEFEICVHFEQNFQNVLKSLLMLGQRPVSKLNFTAHMTVASTQITQILLRQAVRLYMDDLKRKNYLTWRYRYIFADTFRGQLITIAHKAQLTNCISLDMLHQALVRSLPLCSELYGNDHPHTGTSSSNCPETHPEALSETILTAGFI